MLSRMRQGRRPAAVLVESAVVYPVLFLLLFGLIVGGLGVFRYEQVACQAREASRWASVHGNRWHQDTNQPCPTADDIRTQVVLPLAASMDPAKLAVRVQWVDETTGTASDWDESNRAVTGLDPSTKGPVTNRVRVTVTYQWWPELFVAGPVNLKSVSEVPMAY